MAVSCRLLEVNDAEREADDRSDGDAGTGKRRAGQPYPERIDHRTGKTVVRCFLTKMQDLFAAGIGFK